MFHTGMATYIEQRNECVILSLPAASRRGEGSQPMRTSQVQTGASWPLYFLEHWPHRRHAISSLESFPAYAGRLRQPSARRWRMQPRTEQLDDGPRAIGQ